MKTDILTIMGTRPQFIKCSVLRSAYVKFGISEILIDTGQHYDTNMSTVFFEQLGQKNPEFILSHGGLSHATMIASMMIELEALATKINPKCIVVLGDTISTLAGSLIAKQLGIKLIHIEAGLRSFDKTMPEEQNRIVTDHLSDLLFCPTSISVENLLREGISKNVHLSGDVMFDAAIKFKKKFRRPKQLPSKITKNTYDLITIHRAEALISSEALSKRFEYILSSSQSTSRILLLHPHTEQKIAKYKINTSEFFILPPQGYLETQWLLQHSNYLFTDSGGMQKEAFFYDVPTTTLRNTTEWPETITHGKNKLWSGFKQISIPNKSKPFGLGDASTNIARYLKIYISKINL